MLKKILCVDDEVRILSALKRVFHGKPYNLIFKDNGADALSEVKNNKPDLIFLDVKMPHMDGYQFLEKLKENDAGDIPVVMLTGEKETEQMMKGYGSGSVYYITKPTNKRYVLNIVEYFLDDITEERKRQIECEL